MVKCCTHSARDLRSRITIERKSVSRDNRGGHSETWATLAEVWAKWEPLRGSERFAHGRTQPGASVRAVIRWRGNEQSAPYYSSADRVTYRGRTYAIDAVMEIDDRREWLHLMLVEGAPS